MKNLFIISLMAILYGCTPNQDLFQGYVEGEFIYLSPTSSGILAELNVARGQQIESQTPLFRLDSTKLDALLMTATNDIEMAKAQWNNLLKGKRTEELDVLINQQIQTQAQYDHAVLEFKRAKALIKSGAINQATYDMRQTEQITAKARLDELHALLTVVNLGARNDELVVAKLAIDSAIQRKVQLLKEREEIEVQAPAAGVIENTYFLAGELVGAGRPVVSLLPKENIKVRFFIPQDRLINLNLGDPVTINCDGCQSTTPGTIRYISSKAEFTPPNIYSRDSRDKFTFMVEATLNTNDHNFKPRLPVEITLQ